MTKQDYIDVYDAVVERVKNLLKDNQEWHDRYAGYADALSTAAPTLQAAAKKFRVPAPFQLYLSVSMAKKCTKDKAFFELRFHGRSVATLMVSLKNDEVQLAAKKPDAICNALQNLEMTDAVNHLAVCAANKNISWKSEEAKLFRKIYSDLELKMTSGEVSLPGQPEHDMESWLLQNYAQKSSVGKELLYIQPVTMAGTDAKFQMPTPLRASNAKDGTEQITYAKQYGGGIDILARMGRGKQTTLAIMELKDENKKTEPPEKAIRQAIAYATFIRALLRDTECGSAWWHFFGFGGEIPKKLNLKAIIVMPNAPGTATDFVGETISLGKNDDKITEDTLTLGYIYRGNGGLKQEIHID